MTVDWLALLQHFASLSLLAIGGAMTTTPEMHRYLVEESGWLTNTQFASSIALAQVAPGPNVLYVALLGWNVGLNAAGPDAAAAWLPWSAVVGMFVSIAGILAPSTALVYLAGQWSHRNRARRSVRAFKAGMAPIVIALLAATAWLLTSTHATPSRDWPLWTLTAIATLVAWRTRLHLLWLIGAGGILGAFGLV